MSYSSALVGKKQTVTVGTQTDIVACKCIPVAETREETQNKATNTLSAEQSTSTGSNKDATAQPRKNSITTSKPNTTLQARKSPVPQEKQTKTQPNRKHSLSPLARDKESKLSKTNIAKESNRSSKRSNDPIPLFNRHQNIEDMEGDLSDGELQGGKQPFKPNQIKHPP